MKKILIELLIGFTYITIMGLIKEIDCFSMAVGSGLVLIWDTLDKFWSEK